MTILIISLYFHFGKCRLLPQQKMPRRSLFIQLFSEVIKHAKYTHYYNESRKVCNNVIGWVCKKYVNLFYIKVKGFDDARRITYKEPKQTGKNGGIIMKNRFKKILMLSAAAVLLAGSVSDVAYAHSNHHSSKKTAAVCYAACYQDGGCTQNGTCDVNGICQSGGYCIRTSYCQDSTVCNESHYTEHHTGGWSGHHSERGHSFHH